MGLDGLACGAGPLLTVRGDLPHAQLLAAVARRRVYVHLTRWTSLGLSLLEAMTMGGAVVALATTEAVMAVPAGAGIRDTNVADLIDGCRHFLDDPADAARAGAAARTAALRRYGLPRFLREWDGLIDATVHNRTPTPPLMMGATL